MQRPILGHARTAISAFALSAMLALGAAEAQAANPATVGMGNAGSFAVLAGTSIGNTPTSTISGNVGLSPGPGANISGLGCLEVTGTIYAVDATGLPCFTEDLALMTNAKNDLGIAFDDAEARLANQDITGVNLAGQSYGPGVYNSTNAILISGPVPLTLNGGGNADSVFIFQAAAAGDLTVAPTSTVKLINGAQPCNVFWKVQSAFLQNTGFDFVGTVMALTQITATSDITVQGRLLARNADVTLIQDTITKPSSCVTQASIDAANAAASAAAAVAAQKAADEAAAKAAKVAADDAAAKVAAEKEAADAQAAADAAKVKADADTKVKADAAAKAKKAADAKKAAAAKKAADAKKKAAAKKAKAKKDKLAKIKADRVRARRGQTTTTTGGFARRPHARFGLTG
jgi:hypothetical protein